MAKEFIHGKMAGDTKEIILMTNNKVTVNIHGPMVECMRVNGKTVNSMEEVPMRLILENKKQVYGKTEKELNGKIRAINQI